jgi:hypothetical protein
MSFWKKRGQSASIRIRAFSRATGGRNRPAWRAFQGRRLQLEALEDRCVLSVATVNTALDVVDLSDGVTSLREAVFITNILDGHDTIQFAESLHGQTITLSEGELAISDDLTIVGPGGNLIVIDATEGDDTPELNDGQGSRIFNVNDGNGLSAIEVSISGVSLRGGDAAGNGGGILNVESLTLSEVNISSNNATGNGGGVYNENGSLTIERSNFLSNVGAMGGGVYSTGGNLTIDSSTFAGNLAEDKGAGVYSSDNAADIVSSTFSGNIAEVSGGGLFLHPGGTSTASVRHSTITLNNALTGGGIAVGAGAGSVTLDHTITARNSLSAPTAPDVSGAIQARHSLIGSNAGATITEVAANLIGTALSPINPLLGELNNWGGPTQTHPLFVGSPAIDAGDAFADEFDSVPDEDQRGDGFERIENGVGSGARIDIGAYEVQSGTITGYKWNDLDGDGEWDQPSEPALPGWIIYIDANNNGSLDAGESWTITDANGAYSFTGLPRGNYLIREIVQPGWTQTNPGDPQPTSIIVNGGFETGNLNSWISNGFTINNGLLDPPSPDGPLPPYEGSFNAMWNSGSGTRDIYQTVTLPVGEPLTLNWAHRVRNHHTAFLPNSQQVRVEVRSTTNVVLATLFTTSSGDQLLQNWTEHSADISAFAGQTVRIAFVVIANNFYLNLHVDEVNITTGGAGSVAVALTEGQVAEVNFGNWIEPTGEIRGAKWNDLNGNGVWDQPTEQGLAGWTIYLDANENGGLDAGELWTTTDATGHYSFTGLPHGEYLVSELMLPGWEQTSPTPLDPSGLVVNGGFETGAFNGWTQNPTNTYVINNGAFDPPGTELPSAPFDGSFNAVTNTSNAGIYQDVAIPANSHYTLRWAHRIRNTTGGFQDPNIEFRVEIRNTNNQVLQTVFSTNPGDMLLQEWTERSADLSAYAGQTIRIMFFKGTTSSLTVGIDNVRITNERPLSAIPVELGIGEVVDGINFGNWIPPLGEIHGYKWHDVNGNGQWEQPDEPGLANTVVYIDANANGSLDFGERWTTTASDGSYSFTDLPAGNYFVAEVVPAGWSQTAPTGEIAVGPERLFAVRGAFNSQTIYELDPTTGASIRAFPAPLHGNPGAQGLAMGPTSLFYIEGSSTFNPHVLWELDANTGEIIDSDVIDGQESGPVLGLAYLNGRVYIQKLGLSNLSQILVWDPVADQMVATLSPGVTSITGLTAAADLGVLFAVSSNGLIYKLDPQSGAVLATFSVSSAQSASGLAYINGELIVSRTTTESTAYRINPASGAILGLLTLGGTGTTGALAGDGAHELPLPHAQVVSVEAHEIVTGVNFGNWIAPPAEIHGYKWHDLDGDGVWDQPDEPALQGWLIYLDANQNGLLDSGEHWTTTAADGSYSFTGLPAGEHLVAELTQPGWTNTAPNSSHPDRQRVFVARGTSTVTTILELDPETGSAIGGFAPPIASAIPTNVGLAVGPRSLFFVDGNGTGTHTLYELNPDSGAIIDSDIVDSSLTGVIDGLAYLNGKVYIQKPSSDRILVWDPVTDTLVTTLIVAANLQGGLTGAADLGVLYAGLGTASIVVIHPDSGKALANLIPSQSISAPLGLAYWNGQLIVGRSGSQGSVVRLDPFTGQVLGGFVIAGGGVIGALGGDGVSALAPSSQFVELVPGQSATNVNFGNWIAGPAEIHGYKWNDLDADGDWDQDTEPGLAGWTIFIDLNLNNVVDAGDMVTTTGADGSYSFTGLNPGAYAVREVVQPNWGQTSAPPFVSLQAGELETGVNFGNRALPGSISGFKWNDLDGDGVKEAGEPGLEDWIIFIDSNTNGMLDEGERWAETEFNGEYSFSDVPVGSYTLAEEQHLNWQATLTPGVVVVGPAQHVQNVNFGNKALPGSIRGQKWNDLDGDGVRDEGEPGLAGWTIFIDLNNNGELNINEQSTVTDENGNYEFTGLAPGQYQVTEIQQPGWQSVAPKTFRIQKLIDQLTVDHATITALVPNRYDFLEGESGDRIIDGGNNMYDEGNIISANSTVGIPYTNGVLRTNDGWFGEGSKYFTVKHPGLFVLGVTDLSAAWFEIAGAYGGRAEAVTEIGQLSTTIGNDQYTVFFSRVHSATPSINELIIVPGDGAGIQHYSQGGAHGLNDIQAVNRLFYLLVSSQNGSVLSDADMLNIGNAFLQSVENATAKGTIGVSVEPAQNVENVNFGNVQIQPLAGDYNRDQSVDAADYVFWRKFMTTEALPPYSGADGDGDSLVDDDDHEVWSEHFGGTMMMGGGGVAAGDDGAAFVQTATASSEQPVVVDDASSIDAASSMPAPAPSDLHALLFEVEETRSDMCRSIGTRGSIVGGVEDFRDVAMRTWLDRTAARRAIDFDASDDGVDEDESARDECFETYQAAFAGVGTELRWRKQISRLNGRLAAAR